MMTRESLCLSGDGSLTIIKPSTSARGWIMGNDDIQMRLFVLFPARFDHGYQLQDLSGIHAEMVKVPQAKCDPRRFAQFNFRLFC